MTADLSGPGGSDQLRAAQGGPGGQALVGVRHQLQEEPDQEWLARPQVRAGLRAVAAAGLAYDLVISPHQLPLVTETVTALPEVRFVLDHAGKPSIASGRPGGGDPGPGPGLWRPGLRTCGRWRPGRTWRSSCPGWSPRRTGTRGRPGSCARSWSTCWSGSAPDRTMFGSDWPVCMLAASYAEVASAAAAVLDGLGAAARAAVRGGTARTWYRLDEHRAG